MKQFLFSLALIAGTVSSAFAFEITTKAENDAAMAANRKVVVAKVSELQSKITAHNSQGIKTASQELLKLMYKGMTQAHMEINFERGEQQVQSNKKYNELEKTVYEFKQLSSAPKPNAAQLLEHAQTFLTQY